MMSPFPTKLQIIPSAAREIQAARRWYAERSAQAARRFMLELRHGLEQVAAFPEAWTGYLHGTRAYRLKKYPYMVVYRELSGILQVVSIAHARRRPGYWRHRIKS